VHRCGRTGRAGKSGKAVTFFTGEGHEKSLAGEFMRVLRDAGAEVGHLTLGELIVGTQRDGQVSYDDQEEG
jgi:superfamily II DNA/RNA helicase